MGLKSLKSAVLGLTACQNIGIDTSPTPLLPKMFFIALVQTKAISCNSANKSFLMEVVHTKAISALTQFCDFFIIIP